MPSHESYFYQIAQPLIERGIPVIPLRPHTKIAFLEGWQEMASTDLEKIATWSAAYPDANCGAVALAKPVGFWFWEIDKPEVLEAYKRDTGLQLPKTFRVRSRPGRGHFYFRHNATSMAMGNIAQNHVKGDGFSVRTNREYVVAPGSIHPISGLPYEVVSDAPIIEADEITINWLLAQKLDQKTSGTTDPEQPILSGKRNDALTSLGGSMRQKGFSAQAIEAALQTLNRERCHPPLDQDEVRTIAYSVARYEVKPERPCIIGGRNVADPARAAVPAESVIDVEEFQPEKLTASSYPAMGDDLISQYSRLLVEGTAIPFGHVRENLKNVLAFCLSSDIRYPGHEKLILRGWHFNVGEPETCKTTAWDYVKERWAYELVRFGVHVDRLSSYGSAQFLVKGFEAHPKMLLYASEGNQLATANEHVPAIFGCLADLYDQSYISAGSFKNKSARCDHAEGSCVICITPDDFRRACESKGMIGGGILPRWTMSYSDRIAAPAVWPPRDEEKLKHLQDEMIERLKGVVVTETPEAIAIRTELSQEFNAAGRCGKRLVEHYKREALLQAVFVQDFFSEVGVITEEIAMHAAAWARHQLYLRQLYWPMSDAGNHVERMEAAMRGVLQKASPKAVSLTTLKRAAHVFREGSGGFETFQRAYRALAQAGEMQRIGATRKGVDLFVYAGQTA